MVVFVNAIYRTQAACNSLGSSIECCTVSDNERDERDNKTSNRRELILAFSQTTTYHRFARKDGCRLRELATRGQRVLCRRRDSRNLAFTFSLMSVRMYVREAQAARPLYRAEKKSWYVVARNLFLLLLNFSAWPCLCAA